MFAIHNVGNIETLMEHMATNGSQELYCRKKQFYLVIRNMKVVTSLFIESVEDQLYKLDEDEAKLWMMQHAPLLCNEESEIAPPLQIRLPKYLRKAVAQAALDKEITMNKLITSILRKWLLSSQAHEL